jgi:TRAP-type C4-dicarboxylate transport system substrate-binding protein
MPMMFRDWHEVDHVREALRPQLEHGLANAGYVVIFWGDAGWVRFFSSRRIEHPQDLKALRVYADGGEPASLALMRDFYTPVPLDPDKILLGLRNGMIDAVPIPAFLANFLQVPGHAAYMLDVRWVPIVGALILTRGAFDALPAATQEYLLLTGRAAGNRIRGEARIEDDQAVAAMRDKQGLRIVAVPPAVEAEWREQVSRMYPRIRGDVVPAATFDAAVAALDAYRRGGAAAAAGASR